MYILLFECGYGFVPFIFLFISFPVTALFDGKTEVKQQTLHCASTFRWETASPKSPQAALPSAAPPAISVVLLALQTTPSRTSSGLAATTVSFLRSRFFLCFLSSLSACFVHVLFSLAFSYGRAFTLQLLLVVL